MLKVAPEKFWDFSAALFKQQTDFFDARVANEGRNKTYERLAKIAGQTGVNESQVLELLKINEDPNDQAHAHSGNGVTTDIKRMVKVSAGNCGFRLADSVADTFQANRVIGVHVTPTVFFDVWQPRQKGIRTDLARDSRNRRSAAASLPPSGRSGWQKTLSEASRQ